MKKRWEVEAKDTWRLEDLFPTHESWEKEFLKAKEALGEYDRFKGRLGESAGMLADALDFDSRFSLGVERLYVYARMRSDEDTANQENQERFGRIQSLSFEASRRSSFLVPEILEISPKRLEEWIEREPRVRGYRRFLDQLLARREHTRSREIEELLAQAQDALQGAAQVFAMFNNADIRFPAVTGENGQPLPVTHGNFISLMSNEDRRIRREAFHALYSVYGQFQNTLAAAFGANVKQAVFYARARGYSSSREYYLSQNEIPESVYDNLVASVREHLPLLHRYVQIRKRAMGLEELHFYDLYAPMVAGVDRTYTLEEAKKLALAGLKPLGEEYGALLEEGFKGRWIDAYENEGKRSGAYSWGAYGTHPYVLMNFDGRLNDVFTLVHEMGHSLHTYYSNQAQPYVYAGYRIFVAEVASTCNEALLIRYLLENSRDPREKRYLVNHFLESFRATLFRQTMFAEFEKGAHDMALEGRPLTAQALRELYFKLNQDYFGPDIRADEEIGLEWERIPHFYTPFYVYQYATGFSAAVAISSGILKGDAEILEGYRRFLGGGCSMAPMELLKLCGVDMTTKQPVEEAMKVFEGLLNQFEELGEK